MDKIHTVLADIYEYFRMHRDVIVDVIEDLDCYNGYICENDGYPWVNMSDFDETMRGCSPHYIAEKISQGDFNIYHNYFRFDEYGNLESSDVKNYDELFDMDFVFAVFGVYDVLSSVADNEYLSKKFDELQHLYDEATKNDVKYIENLKNPLL